MKSSKAGEVKIGVVVLIVAVVAAAAYFLSDPFRTKADAAYDQFSKWTPENIAKDPENYLNFCEKQANDAVLKLKASQISVAQNRANLDTMKKDAADKVALGTKALAELKQLYTEAEAGKKWPVTWQGGSRDQDWVKRQIVSFNRQVTGQESLKAKVEAGLKQLDNQATKIQEASSQANEQISQIKTSREMLKVQKITADLSKQLVNIGSTLQATISTASESSGTITLDQLQAESATTVDETEFSKIMGK